MRGHTRRLAMGALITALAFGAMAAPAAAQFGEAAGLTEIMHPEYLRRDITIFVQGLDLDETQQVILEALYDEYETEFHQGFAAMTQRYDNADWRDDIQQVANDRQKVLEMAFRPLREWASERSSLGEQFVSNVKVLLSPTQLEQWPEFERMFTREKTMHLARISGEQCNLFHVIRDMHLDAGVEAMIRPIMLQYSIQLDEALRRRNQALSSETSDVFQTLIEADERASVAEIERQTRLRVAVREVNDTYITLIAQALPDPVGQDFRARAMEAAYPRIYRSGATERMYELALASEELNDTERAEVNALWTRYQEELEAINQQLLRALQTYDPQLLRRRAEQYVARQEGGQLQPLANPTRDGFQERSLIHDRYAQALLGAIRPEIFAELPGSQKYLKTDR